MQPTCAFSLTLHTLTHSLDPNQYYQQTYARRRSCHHTKGCFFFVFFQQTIVWHFIISRSKIQWISSRKQQTFFNRTQWFTVGAWLNSQLQVLVHTHSHHMFSACADSEWDFSPDSIKPSANVCAIKEPVFKHNLCRIWLIFLFFFFPFLIFFFFFVLCSPGFGYKRKQQVWVKRKTKQQIIVLK